MRKLYWPVVAPGVVTRSVYVPVLGSVNWPGSSQMPWLSNTVAPPGAVNDHTSAQLVALS